MGESTAGVENGWYALHSMASCVRAEGCLHLPNKLASLSRQKTRRLSYCKTYSYNAISHHPCINSRKKGGYYVDKCNLDKLSDHTSFVLLKTVNLKYEVKFNRY